VSLEDEFFDNIDSYLTEPANLDEVALSDLAFARFFL